MSKTQWNNQLSVGDPKIDNDHKGLFDLISELESTDMSRGFFADVIGRLEHYAAAHFTREEELMKSVGFPGFDEHIKEHQLFVEWIDTVKTTYRRAAESPFLISDLVNNFLKEWLINHIMKEDMKYRDFILSKKQD